MARKKSGKLAAATFKEATERIWQFVEEVEASKLSDQTVTWAYEAAVIKTAVAFEKLMLDCLVTAVNNDTSTISQSTGIAFPKHLTDEVCEYLVTGGGYFDFKGRDGLIKVIKKFVPEDHYLLQAVRKAKYKDPLNLLLALRNFAAHESPVSKTAVLRETKQQRIGSAGAWVKRQWRFWDLRSELDGLAAEISDSAPY